MRVLFLGSAVEGSGKSTIALGLAHGLQGIGYFKPFRESMVEMGGRQVDRDAFVMRSALKLDRDVDVISPFTYDAFDPKPMQDVLDAFHAACDGYEIAMIEGTRDIITGCMGSVSGLAIASKLGAEVVLVSPDTQEALDKICMLRSVMDQYRLAFRGVILNRARDPRTPKLLERKGIRTLGSVPHVRELDSTVAPTSPLLAGTVSQAVRSAVDVEELFGFKP